ncbi:TetR/AcrR family transcriptional regulator [Lederbergia wuyishanensis]|uniref:AcrR family transcriptional regulator n=1 Tax=Lederbergia wuyishanensis TaxID=1347903 RepID=A0ABU0D803_9BACI|nr:TetR/AcrR family transcriptional regulator [Lederbergia wuyishanensis]MCJ8009313.1 TetR/AcrR family transcriptional regulator [Lederbergia wuyishanensis]MDQ0344553.1 AcrR family transcriptional regulator [Lederbergia wuyishanensis]
MTIYLTFVRIRVIEVITISTKEKILNAAIDLFSKSSFSAVSIRDITREVGIKESSLYYHFKNKDELLECIFEIYREEIKKVCPPLKDIDYILTQTTPEQFLLHGLQKFKSLICDNPKMSKISRILSTEQFSHPKARYIISNDLYEENIKFLEVVFTKFMESEYIQEFPARLLAIEYQYPVFSMITQYQILQFEQQDTSELEKLLEDHVKFFFYKIKK